MKVSLIQSELVWENPVENKKAFDTKLIELYQQTDLVVLPEMFTTGFSMNPQGIASNYEILNYLKVHASKGNFAIYGSVMYATDTGYVNRGIFMNPDGEHTFYDKRHTFTLAGEHNVYDKGEEPVVVSFKNWKINLQICYDLRFPVYSRNTSDYDICIYVANWPVPRVNAWDALLKARAIENMCYTIGVNRTGKDGTGMDYNGHSQVYDVLGKELIDVHPWEQNGIKTVLLDKNHISHYRDKLKFLQDRDRFNLL